LNIFPIYIPSLRERVADILPLVNHFILKFQSRFRKNIQALERESLRRLEAYTWPGNIRELEHVIERAMLLTDGEILKVELSLGQSPLAARTAHSRYPKELVPFSELERAYMERVLESTGGVIEGNEGAAEIVKLKASTLRSRLKKLGILYGARRRSTQPLYRV
jgi:formate hydrogenlyase transcriptional activator